MDCLWVLSLFWRCSPELYCDGQVELLLIPPCYRRIDRRNYHLFQPLLDQVPPGSLVSRGQACKSGERQQPATILEFLLNAEALRGSIVSSDTIYPALSNKARSAATERNLGDFQLTFLLIEARH
jgi:hypothetical protein